MKTTYILEKRNPLKNSLKRKEKHRCLQFKTKPLYVYTDQFDHCVSEVWISLPLSLTPSWYEIQWGLVWVISGSLPVSQSQWHFNSFELLAINRTLKNRELLSKFIPILRKTNQKSCHSLVIVFRSIFKMPFAL